MRAHKPIWKATAALCAIAAACVVACTPAGAEVTHKYLSSITEVPRQGPKGESVAQPGLLNYTNSMTIDGSDLYLAENFGIVSGESRIDVFNTTSHAFVKQLERPNPPVYDTVFGMAVGHPTGSTQVYVGAGEERSSPGEANAYVVVPLDAEGHQIGTPWTGEDTPNGAFSGQTEEVGSREGSIQSIAVDNDPTRLFGDWAAGDIFVDTSTNRFGQFPALNVVDILKPEANGTEKYEGQLTGTCESPGACPGKIVPFFAPRSVAVDSRSGDVAVVDQTKNGTEAEPTNAYVVDMFRPGPSVGEYEFIGSLTGSPNGPFQTIRAIAVDGGEGGFAEGAIYVAEEANHVYQFDSTGQYIGQFSTSHHISSIAVDPSSHDVFLGQPDGEEGQVQIFGPSLLLPDVTTAPVSSLAPEGATLNGTVNPEKAGTGETTCQFVWGTSESFGHVLSCPHPVAEGESPVPVSGRLEGLEPDTTYYFRLQASNANGIDEGVTSQTLHFTTPGPGIAEESAYSISSTSATLSARLDAHGSDTSYYFQYGTTPTYGSDIPAAPGESLGASEGAVEVAPHQLQGLQPTTTYHFRVVVISDLQVEPGVFRETTLDGHDQIFTTQTLGGSLVLPDGRAWELVSPVDKHGAIFDPLRAGSGGQVIKASSSGDAVTYGSTGPTETGPSGYAEGGQQVFSDRGSGGWSSRDIGLPHRAASGIAIGHGGDYRFFSEDLSLGVAEEIGPFTSLAPETTVPDTERTPYLRHDDTCGSEPDGCYVPLVTGAPGSADVPSGTVLDLEPTGAVSTTVGAVAGTPDLSHVLLTARVALTEEPITGGGLYEWSSGKPPSEELKLIDGEKATLPANGRDAISTDGSHVIFVRNGGGHLYQRDTATGQTIQLDEVQPGASGAGVPSAILEAASSDGSVIYFTDGQRLTKDSDARGNPGVGVAREPDLYECKISEVAGKTVCDLRDLTPETAGQRANVQNWVLGASEDGDYVYFVATAALSDQAAANGERALAGAPNLYESHDGTTRLIAVLSGNDGNDWGGNSNVGEAFSAVTARVSPDGNYLAFMSDRSLTGYDNVNATSDRPDEEVFMFDSSIDRLTCASCNPTGARPQELKDGGAEHLLNIAGSIPAWTAYEGGTTVYQSRYLSDSGRLFFDSSDALVPQDINKNEDVYEYEPASVGDCTAASVAYVGTSGGCVGLISSGTARGESSFLDASENGDDVFFLTTEKLTANDVDTSTDVYDAHVCSPGVPCSSASTSPPPCVTADACRAAPVPQPSVFGSPSSATFAGAGNVGSIAVPKTTPKSLTRSQKLARALKGCRREKGKRRRAACERRTRKLYSRKQARRARVTRGSRG